MSRRIRWLGIALILCFSLVLVQLTHLQAIESGPLSASPGNPRNAAKNLDNNRGDILAADGTVLAYSKPTHAPGSYKYQRVYPPARAGLFSDIVGYASDLYGTWGIEYQYNDQLISHSQPAGSLGELLNPMSGTDDVTLTVQPKLQEAAQSALAGRDGAVVVLDPSTGAVLALYANPTYDPNLLASTSPGVQTEGRTDALNKDDEGYDALGSLAYSQRWAPGSTFKVITASAAYDYKPDLVAKSYPVRVATPLPDSNLVLHNDGGTACGGTIAQMLPPSCDPGFADLGLDLGATALANQAEQFGYNSVPPLDIPGVVPATFPAANQFSQNLPGLAYSAIGQEDVAATALQGALEAAAIANHGTIMTPHLMAQIRNAQGAVVSTYAPKPWRQATTAATAAALTPLMRAVVTSGTAEVVGFPAQDQVAAKTGTAQAGQANQLVTAWMIAFAPASGPQVAIAVVLPDQTNSATGALEAGPIVKAMIEASLAMSSSVPAVTKVPTPAAGASSGVRPTTPVTAPGAPATTTTTAAPATTTIAPTSP